MDDRRLGILGGGRVARLLTLAAHRLGLNICAIDELGTDSPVGQITNSSIEGKIEDPQNIQTLASQCEVLTSVIGCVDTSLLQNLEEQGLSVHPSSSLTEVLQSLIKQREAFSEATIPCVQSASVSSVDDASEAVSKLGLPLLLRSDNHQGDSIFIESLDDLNKTIQTNPKKVWLCERYVEVTRSLVVIVARNIHGQCVAYPVSEMVRNSDGTESATLTPARVDHKLTSHVISYAKKSITTLQAVGCFGVEVSVTRDDDIFVDRLACRVHEAGNFTIEACGVDQYEQHLRCILGLSLQGTQLTSAYALCINVLGTGDDSETKAIGMQSLSLNGARVHWYGKQEQQGSHMGHITIVADNLFRLRKECSSLKSACADQLLSDVTARVGVIMGSDSDLPCMRACADVLEELSIEFELTIVSAHRTPHRLVEYAENAEKRGIQVIVAGAGGAAHLPGMVASLTTLPVIGVPVKTSTLHGVDSLYSIVQMPRGIPVATVAIGNAKNAGLLAARILGSFDIVVRRRLAEYSRVQEKVVEQKASKLEQIGYKAYLNESSN